MPKPQLGSESLIRATPVVYIYQGKRSKTQVPTQLHNENAHTRLLKLTSCVRMREWNQSRVFEVYFQFMYRSKRWFSNPSWFLRLVNFCLILGFLFKMFINMKIIKVLLLCHSQTEQFCCPGVTVTLSHSIVCFCKKLFIIVYISG